MESLLETLLSDEQKLTREIQRCRAIIRQQHDVLMQYKQALCDVIERLSPETGSDEHEKCCELYNDVLQIQDKYSIK
jgi:hypothetical protein